MLWLLYSSSRDSFCKAHDLSSSEDVNLFHVCLIALLTCYFFFSCQIRLVNGLLELLLNSSDITDTIATVNSTNFDSSIVSFERTEETSILSTFSNDIGITVTESLGLLSFVVTAPEEFEGQAEGLLGNFNGDASDDYRFPDGRMISVNSTDSQIHEFGQSCKLV